MARRKIGVIVGILAVIAFIAVYLLFFNKRNETVIYGMPQDVLCFFDVKNIDAFDPVKQENVIINELSNLQIVGSLQQNFDLFNKVCGTKAELLSDILNQNFLAGAFPGGKNTIEYLFLLQLDEAAKIKLNQFIPEYNDEMPTVSNHKFEKTEIYEFYYSKNKMRISVTKEAGVFIFSTSTVLVENAVKQLKQGNPVTENNGFKEVYNHIDKKAGFVFYLNTEQLSNYLSGFAPNEKYAVVMQMQKYNSWIGAELHIAEAGIAINGYASAKNNSSALQLSEYTGEYAIDMHPVIPANTVVLYRINADNLIENLAAEFTNEKLNRDFFDYWAPWMKNNLLIGISESLDKNFLNKTFLIIPANDKLLATNKLKYAIISDTIVYRDNIIMELKAGDLISGIAKVKFPEINYAAWYQNDLIITTEIAQLRNMLDAAENGETLAEDGEYNEFKNNISSSFNTSVYLNLSKAEQIIGSFISDKNRDSLEQNFNLLQKFPKLEIQFSNSKQIYLINGFLSYNAAPKRKNGVLWKLQVDYPIESGPYTVFNQVTNQKSIIVQDTAHQMYLISANGDVLWKQQLPNKISDAVHEVDFYGNDKTQILFNTPDAIYLMDMNGNAVEGFPITLTSKITNPITVLMNAKNDYRMYVACNNDNIYGFYKDGKPIPGWNPQNGTGTVTQPLFSVKDNNADAIAFINNTSIQVRKSNGKANRSIPIKGNVVSIAKESNATYFMLSTGDIIKVDAQLNSNTTSYTGNYITGNFADINADDTTDIIMIDDGYFKAKTISGKSLFVAEIDSIYKKTIRYHFKNTDYFGVASSSNIIILFSSDGKVYDGFPVKGSANFVIDDITKNGDKMLVTIANNTLYTYRIK